jgi:hypothetical protein
MLLDNGHKVRAMVRRVDERAESLRQLGAEVRRISRASSARSWA